jgi:hypothetical protein
MKMTGMAVMMVATASAWAGATPAETRQLTICMESVTGNLVPRPSRSPSGAPSFRKLGQLVWNSPANLSGLLNCASKPENRHAQAGYMNEPQPADNFIVDQEHLYSTVRGR